MTGTVSDTKMAKVPSQPSGSGSTVEEITQGQKASDVGGRGVSEPWEKPRQG